MIARIVLFAATTLAAASALAQDGKTGLYVYGSVGISMAEYDSGQARTSAETAFGPGASFKDDSDRYAGKALIGYKFNKYLGIEGGYVDVAKISIDASGPGGSGTAEAKLRGAQLAAVAWLPMTPQLSLFLKLGGAAIRTSYKSSTAPDDKTNDVQTFFGLGFQYDFSNDFFGRAEYERYSKYGNSSTGDVSANIYSVGLGYKF